MTSFQSFLRALAARSDQLLDLTDVARDLGVVLKRRQGGTEIVKAFVNRGEEPRIYFWRTSAGEEVDVIVEAGGKLIPIETKLSSTPRPAMASGIRTFQDDLGDRSGPVS